MAYITLPINSARPSGKFFNQVAEAVMRGGKIVYRPSTIELSLVDDRFFNVDEVESILKEGGDVELFPLKVILSLDEYKNGIVPASIASKLGYEAIVEDDEYKGEYKWCEIFSHYYPIEKVETTDEDRVTVSLSTKSEWIKASIAKEIADHFHTDLL